MKVTVMSFNAAHFEARGVGKDCVDYKAYAEVLKKHGADIICLNEVYGAFYGGKHEHQVDLIASLIGYEHGYFAEAIKVRGKYPYGNGMLSKHGFCGITVPVPDPSEAELNGEPQESRCVLRADLELKGKRLTVLNCHFGLNIAERKNAAKTVCSIADTISNPVILTGDFNTSPDSEILNPIRARFNDTEDLFTCENRYTFPSEKPCKKIDYIFYRGDIAAVSAEVLPDVISDHLAVSAVFKL